MNRPVDLTEKLGRFAEHWSPQLVARMNDYEMELVELRGEFVRHAHDDTDALCLVLDGSLLDD